jgi:N-acetylneuraminate synthase
LDLLEKCGVEPHKIGSNDATNLPFLLHVSKRASRSPSVTGMCTLDEVRDAVDTIVAEGNKEITAANDRTPF